MSKYNFSASDVAKAVRKLAVKNPDFNYTMQEERPSISTDCSYLSAGLGVEGGKACIVGQALTSLGVSDKHLSQVETLHASIAVIRLAENLLSSAGDNKTLDWLDRVQEYQDRGVTWSNAVELADNE